MNCALCGRPLAGLFGTEPSFRIVGNGRICVPCHNRTHQEPKPVPDVAGQRMLLLEGPVTPSGPVGRR